MALSLPASHLAVASRVSAGRVVQAFSVTPSRVPAPLLLSWQGTRGTRGHTVCQAKRRRSGKQQDRLEEVLAALSQALQHDAEEEEEEDSDADEAPLVASGARAVDVPADSLLLAARLLSGAQSEREAVLWRRQDALWEREMARWAAERQAWAAREAALLAQLDHLRAALLHQPAAAAPPPALAPGSPTSRQGQLIAPVEQAGPAAGLAAERTQRPAAPGQAAGAGQADSAAREVAATLAAARGQALSAQQLEQVGSAGSPPPRPVTNSVFNTLAPSPAGSGPRQLAPPAEAEPPVWAAQLSGAITAVDTADVLDDALDLLSAPSTPARAQEPRASPAGRVQPAQPTARQPSAQAGERAQDAAAQQAPGGPPPTLVQGADDIYWVNLLQERLLAEGYCCADDEMEDFYFGESTHSALCTYQACVGLADTGVADEALWRRLLGQEEYARLVAGQPSSAAMGTADEEADKAAGSGAGTPGAQGVGSGISASWQALFDTAPSTPSAAAPRSNGDAVRRSDPPASASPAAPAAAAPASAPARAQAPAEWPILREGDGGKAVHRLQVALQQRGFYCGEDDCRWWQFGDMTQSAVLTFQASAGLPESGVVDAAAWRGLLGPRAQPGQLEELVSGDDMDDDLEEAQGGRVWLLGEQRWENPARLRRA